MIVDFRPSCPLQKSTHHAKPDPYTLSDQELLSYQCPNCGSIGSLQKNKTYRRFFAENTEDIKRSCSIMVQVYYCPACQTYHALFHPSVVPFCSYSYAFLGEIYRFYNECKNFAQTAKKFLLSVKVLHSLIRKIQSDLNLDTVNLKSAKNCCEKMAILCNEFCLFESLNSEKFFLFFL